MNKAVFLSLLTFLLIFSAGEGFACEAGKTVHGSVFRSAGHHRVAIERSCCDIRIHDRHGDTEKDCGQDCSQSCCDCGHTLPVFVLKAIPAVLPGKAEQISTESRNWFFEERTPKAVYLSLFIPPNI